MKESKKEEEEKKSKQNKTPGGIPFRGVVATWENQKSPFWKIYWLYGLKT